MLMLQTRGKDAFVFVTTCPCFLAEKNNDTITHVRLCFDKTRAGERSVADELGIMR